MEKYLNRAIKCCPIVENSQRKNKSKKVLTFISSGVILTKLSRETNRSNKTAKINLKKLLTSDKRCDNLIWLSRKTTTKNLDN